MSVSHRIVRPDWSATPKFHSEFGYLAPSARFRRVIRLAAVCAVLAVGLYVRVPGPSATDKQLTTERVDIEQVEKTLEDLDILTPAI